MTFSIRPIKWFFQRLFRGYSDLDLWNLDLTLSGLILPRLKAYRYTHRYSVPLHPTRVDKGGNPEGFTEQEWNAILDKMIFSFECITHYDYDDDLFTNYYTETDREKQKQIVVDLTPDLKQRSEDIQEGLRLFGKYFTSLGD